MQHVPQKMPMGQAEQAKTFLSHQVPWQQVEEERARQAQMLQEITEQKTKQDAQNAEVQATITPQAAQAAQNLQMQWEAAQAQAQADKDALELQRAEFLRAQVEEEEKQKTALVHLGRQRAQAAQEIADAKAKTITTDTCNKKQRWCMPKPCRRRQDSKRRRSF